MISNPKEKPSLKIISYLGVFRYFIALWIVYDETTNMAIDYVLPSSTVHERC